MSVPQISAPQIPAHAALESQSPTGHAQPAAAAAPVSHPSGVAHLSDLRHPSGVAPLPHLGVMRVRGADAAAFLQGQLTQDVQGLPVGQARLAALCTPKGRMRASFWVCRWAADDFLLLCSADVLAATIKRLGMFVMRAKVALADATQQFCLLGLMGDAAAAQPADGALVLPLPPADGMRRALWLADAGVPAPAATVAEADWLLAEVRSGVARITAAVAEAFVPQMLNYESVGGVHFKKGCYPGQEVVARSQFRGTIKRRAFVGHAAGAVRAGQEIFAQGDAEQPVGMVAQAAPMPDGTTAVIAEVQTAAQQAAHARPLAVATDGGGSADGGEGGTQTGVPLGGLHIPYALAEDI